MCVCERERERARERARASERESTRERKRARESEREREIERAGVHRSGGRGQPPLRGGGARACPRGSAPGRPAAWEGQGQVLRRNVKRFRGGLVCKAHRLLYHSTLGLRVIKKKKKRSDLQVSRKRTSSGYGVWPLPDELTFGEGGPAGFQKEKTCARPRARQGAGAPRVLPRAKSQLA